LTPHEALKLQGFDTDYFEGVKLSAMYRMAGNAVAVPVGRFVVDGVLEVSHETEVPLRATQESLFPSELLPSKSPQPPKELGWAEGFIPEQEPELSSHGSGNLYLTQIPRNGFYDETIQIPLLQETNDGAKNLVDFLDTDYGTRLSKKGASGLLRRLNKSGLFCPTSLRGDLEAICRE
jgi:hypothetical protein